MTREEAIAILEVSKHMATSGRMYNQAIDMAIEALQENNSADSLLTDSSEADKERDCKLDLISRQDVIEALSRSSVYAWSIEQDQTAHNWALNIIKALPSADAKWIPCSERLPKDLEAVNVTWVNHNPPCYYIDIMNVPFTATGVYHDGKWYWWDATVIDLLGEYDGAYVHGIEPIDKYIEITAWMPLPKPYKGGDTE